MGKRGPGKCHGSNYQMRILVGLRIIENKKQVLILKIKITPVTEDYRLAQTLARKYARSNKEFLAGKKTTPEQLVDVAIQQLKLNYWEVSEERTDYLGKQISVFIETVMDEVQVIMAERKAEKPDK
jgi:hypothetical protein